MWFDELSRLKRQLEQSTIGLFVAKISGAVGNFANVNPINELYVARQLGLHFDTINTQITLRVRHLAYFSIVRAIANILNQFGMEVRQLARSEIREVSIGQVATSMGSSTMPHKANPIAAERVCGLARYLNQICDLFLANNLTWHERDLTQSANERIAIPDIFHIIVFCLQQTNQILHRLMVNVASIARNIQQAGPTIYSGRVLEYLIQHYNEKRYSLYRKMQRMNHQAMDTPDCTLAQMLTFLPILTDHDRKVLVEEICVPQQVLKNVDYIYEKVFRAATEGYNHEWPDAIWAKLDT